jgi:hypothetical protein
MPLKTINPDKFKVDFKKLDTPNARKVNLTTFENKSDISFKIGENKEGFFVAGEDVMILVELLPENYNENEKDFGPVDFRNDFGFVYDMNGENRKNLCTFLFNINKLHKIYKTQNKTLDFSKPAKRKDTGILGYEVDYKKPRWYVNLMKKYDGDLDIYKHSRNLVFSEKNNPTLLKDKTYKFYKNCFEARDSPIGELRGLRREWGGVYDKEILISFHMYPAFAHLDTKKINLEKLKQHKSFILRMPRHLMFGAVIGNDIVLMDNDDDYISEQVIGDFEKLVRSSEKEEKFKVSFYPRKIEQNDGSCACLSFIRAFMISEFGFESVDRPVPPAYAVYFNMVLTEYNIRYAMKEGYY